MCVSGTLFIAVPGSILRIFTNEPSVIAIGVGLLAVAAFFQLFDGVQVVTTGALRGTGDTRTPMVANLVAHWLVGLPVGYALCFWRGQGVVGLWIGLCLGLVVVAVLLTALWSRRVAALVAAPRGEPLLQPARRAANC